MKIYIWTHGDPSVGINGKNATVDLEGFIFTEEDKEEREQLRAKLKVTYSDIFDERATVMFEDEEPKVPGCHGYEE